MAEFKEVSAQVTLFRNEIVKCVWLDENLSDVLRTLFGDHHAVLEYVRKGEYAKADAWEGLGTHYKKAKAALKEALGIPAANDYLKRLQKGPP